MKQVSSLRKAVSCRPCLAGMLLLFILALASSAYGAIGEEAARRAADAGPIVDPNSKRELLFGLFDLVKVLGLVLLLLVVFLSSRIARLVDFDPFKNWDANRINGGLFALFGLALGFFVWYQVVEYGPYTLGETTTVHGQGVDTLFNITLSATGVAFVLVQFFIFLYAARYVRKAGRKALYYPDNHKLELIWTLVPAFGLALVVLYGVSVWNKIHYPDLAGKEPIHIEMVAEQFKWTVRYAGTDNKLGHADYKLIEGANVLGLDSTDTQNDDDQLVYTKELHVPVNQPITLHARSKDVLHGMYIPHFAVNVYAVPGMPTQFTFTPTKTTDQMRQDTRNPEFNYELACGQLCGSGHWNMRVVVVVEEEQAYKAWLAAQPKWKQPQVAKAAEAATDSTAAAQPAKPVGAAGPTAMNNRAN
ncbi:MAG: cytochrome c oxidase subunit II [Sphingobacteriia bacterium]|jgi:cytochrome c oxidase subunit 2